MGVVADGDLALLHGLEQGTLHFGGGTVDFIGQHKVGEDGPRRTLKGVVFSAVDECATTSAGSKSGVN